MFTVSVNKAATSITHDEGGRENKSHFGIGYDCHKGTILSHQERHDPESVHPLPQAGRQKWQLLPRRERPSLVFGAQY